MKFHRGSDVKPNRSGLLYRQSRTGGLIFALIVVACFTTPIVITWSRGAWFFFAVLSVCWVFLMPLLIGDVINLFRRTNWTLWAPPGKLLINLRSYQDRSSLDSPSVVELTDSEVAEIRRHEHRYTVPHSQSSKRSQKLISLDLLLRTPDDGTLEQRITACRNAPQPWRRFLFMRSQSNPTLHSVSLPEPEVVRIAWNGAQGHNLAPGIQRVLSALETRLHVGEPVLRVDDPAEQAQEAAIDERILTLVQAGNRIDAIKLLRIERGYSLSDAKRFVDELAERT